MLPVSIQNNIHSLLSGLDSKDGFIQARAEQTKNYRAKGGQINPGFASQNEVVAYIMSRFPATFAALEAILSTFPLQDIHSVLDLGAGPGTGAFAAALRWPLCQQFQLIEGDAYMSQLSQQLLKNIPEIINQYFSFHAENLLTYSFKNPHDLVILSYVVNELSSPNQTLLVKKAWEKSTKGMVIVVPGTPTCYQQLMILRDLLVEMGAFIAAPCPHHEACPLQEGDWCHFSTRLTRSSTHRTIKDVSLPYEDEKYSYLIALRDAIPRTAARVIRKPMKRSGHVVLDLCTPDGLQRQTVSKRDKALYKRAIDVAWGESWERE